MYQWLRKVEALDDLLQHIVLDSFRAQHHGTFHAWSETMGSIGVTVEAIRKPPRESGDSD